MEKYNKNYEYINRNGKCQKLKIKMSESSLQQFINMFLCGYNEIFSMSGITPACRGLKFGPLVIPNNFFSMNSKQLFHCFG